MNSVFGEGKFASAEDISGSFDSICSFDSPTVPTELADSLKAMLTAPKSNSKSSKSKVGSAGDKIE